MARLQELYAKVDKMDKEIAELDEGIRICKELMETKIENQKLLVQQRKYWTDRIAYHEQLQEYLQSKAAERKAKEEAERKAEEEAAAGGAEPKRRPTAAKSIPAPKKPRVRSL